MAPRIPPSYRAIIPPVTKVFLGTSQNNSKRYRRYKEAKYKKEAIIAATRHDSYSKHYATPPNSLAYKNIRSYSTSAQMPHKNFQ